MDPRHTLTGIAASPGRTGGAARIVRTPGEAARVESHHILVVEATTPDYVAAMRVAAGVIAAKGGALSHAAVVAREMNKPCVVSVEDALTLIRDGDSLSMDGATGIVDVYDAIGGGEPSAPTKPAAYTPPAPYRPPSFYRREGG